MDFPSFTDFLATLSAEKISDIAGDAVLKSEQAHGSGSGGQIVAIAWTVSLELLALYHEWLREHFAT